MSAPTTYNPQRILEHEMCLDFAQEHFRNSEYTEAYFFLRQIAKNLPADPEEQQSTEPQFVSATDLLQESIAYRKLIGKLVERGCTGQLFGPSGDGKTFVALDMALAIATGEQWNGIQCEQGLVLYFAGEGHHGLKRRLSGWSKHHSDPNVSLFHVSRSTISFDAASIRQVASEVRALEDATGEKVAFIVIDTLARHLEGDENSTRDMSEFIRQVDGLRDTFPESTALIVHHTGNGPENQNRSRGSSALKAACDFEIQCAKGLLVFTKVKDGAAPEPVEFKLVPVEIGTDEDGEAITSCIVQYGERSVKNRESSLSAHERLLYELVKESPGHIDTLRAEFYELRREEDPNVKQGTLKTAFSRTIDKLLAREFITRDGNMIQAAHGTLPAQSGTCAEGIDGTNGTHPYKGVPMCRPLSRPEVLDVNF